VPLDIALEVADEVGVPVMAHIDDPPPSYEEVIARLRPGDVLTHAFRPFPNAPATAQGTVKRAVIEARQRGALFDIGHGKGLFAFNAGQRFLAGYHFIGCSRALHQRPGVRPGSPSCRRFSASACRLPTWLPPRRSMPHLH
jgi:dihydroorotase